MIQDYIESATDLVPGELYRIGSGLGGSFTIKYRGYTQYRYVFDVETPGWQTHGPYRLTAGRVRKRVYRSPS